MRTWHPGSTRESTRKREKKSGPGRGGKARGRADWTHAKGQRTPVDVLQDAFLVVRDLEAEVLFVELVPPLREVIAGDCPVEQALLQLEADDDMQGVGEFVRIDPDQVGALDLREARRRARSEARTTARRRRLT